MVVSMVDGALFDETTNRAVRDVFPAELVAFFEFVTHLGDGATLVAIGVVLYWFGAQSRRRERAVLIAIGLATLSVVAGLKGVVAAPRPDPAVLTFAPADYGGYSFPSAHAMGAAAVYAALAARSTLGTASQRYAIAGVVIVLVALSRVVIGVHFLGDVIVGVAVGLAIVSFALRDPNPSPEPLFALSAVVAVGAFLLGSREYVTLTIGAAVGATVAWRYVSRNPARPYGASILVLGALVLPLLFVLRGIEAVYPDYWIAEIVGYALVTGIALLVPNVAERLNDWVVVVHLQETLPFSGRTVDTDQLPSTRSGD